MLTKIHSEKEHAQGGEETMSEKTELEQLLNEKADLEQEALELEEEKKQVELRAKALCQKIIQELKNENNEKRGEINQLQSKADELESELNKASGCILEHAVVIPNINEDNQEDNGNPVESVDGIEDIDEINVLVTAVDEDTSSENVKTEQAKKKHLFF
jgi:chromosome segregation ATPase